jgi:hypothetical protein
MTRLLRLADLPSGAASRCGLLVGEPGRHVPLARGLVRVLQEQDATTCADGENDADTLIYLELLTLPREMFVAAARLACELSERGVSALTCMPTRHQSFSQRIMRGMGV